MEMCGLPESELFVGRHREMALLRRRLEELAAGTPLVASVVGEAGIGKTTLCSWAMAEAAEFGVRGVRAAGVEGDGSPSYWLWLRLLRQLGIADDIDFEPVSSVMVDPLSRRQHEFLFFEKVSERVDCWPKSSLCLSFLKICTGPTMSRYGCFHTSFLISKVHRLAC